MVEFARFNAAEPTTSLVLGDFPKRRQWLAMLVGLAWHHAPGAPESRRLFGRGGGTPR